MDAPAPAVPAQPVETPAPTVSASFDAASKGDFSAFEKAESASRDGKPLERVAAAKPADKPVESSGAPKPTETAAATEERTVSKRQQQINDYERRIAEQTQRLDQLERELRDSRTAKPVDKPAETAAKPEPEWKRFANMADAPKLKDFDSVEDHAAAMGLFIADKRHEERIAADRQQTADGERRIFLQKQADTLSTSLKTAAEADPDFRTKIPPALLDPTQSVPLSFLPKDARPVFGNVVAEAMLHAQDAAGLALYLGAHPDEAKRIVTTVPQPLWLTELARLDGRLAGTSKPTSPPAATAPVAATPSPITAAPPPAPLVTGAGTTVDERQTALARGDFAAFDRAEMQKEIQKRRSA